MLILQDTTTGIYSDVDEDEHRPPISEKRKVFI